MLFLLYNTFLLFAALQKTPPSMVISYIPPLLNVDFNNIDFITSLFIGNVYKISQNAKVCEFNSCLIQ